MNGDLAMIDNARTDSIGVRYLRQLVQLRWIAVAGQIAAIAVAHFAFDIDLPLATMSFVLAGLVAFNLASLLYWRRRERAGNGAVLASLLVDVAALTAQLYLSGGASNPFVFLYLLQVALGAVLLRTWSSWVMVVVTTLCFVGLVVVDSPVSLPKYGGDGLRDPFVLGLLLCFAINAALLAVFIVRIGRILRARDARLADLRQRAAEEEHIVRMGLLASGAAHELGTPLSTLAVILGDWQHLPHFTSDPELLRDVTEMQAQVLRCKAIVTGILQSAGETRGEAPGETTVRFFFDEAVAQWRESRPVRGFEYRWRFGEDVAIVSDTGLRQMLFNVLDNALEASPEWLALDVLREGERLMLRVEDHGPGFSAATLAHFGEPYNSDKGKPGGGLGLFLSQNVVRTLGGSIRARNGDLGAIVEVSLPLAVLMLEDEEDDDAG